VVVGDGVLAAMCEDCRWP